MSGLPDLPPGATVAPGLLHGSVVVDGSHGVDVVPGPGADTPKVLVIQLVDQRLQPTLMLQIPMTEEAAHDVGGKLLAPSVVRAMALPTEKPRNGRRR